MAAICVGAFAGIWGGKLVLKKLAGAVAIVQGTSMEPTFHPGTRICIAPVQGALKRGDIVVVKDGQGGCAVKRVIALPRETIHLWRGYVFINGQMLREPYLPKYTFTHPDQQTHKNAFALGTGSYFVMGDNRLNSADSRTYGPILQDQIVSVVLLEPQPTPEFAPFALPVHGRQTIRRLQTGSSKVAAL